jgi:F420-non-reducing hydrogenase large subunit
MERITIDPITRLEGHGKIEIFLETGRGSKRLPGSECAASSSFAWPAEEMPLTDRITGVCRAHHGNQALDALFTSASGGQKL